MPGKEMEKWKAQYDEDIYNNDNDELLKRHIPVFLE